MRSSLYAVAAAVQSCTPYGSQSGQDSQSDQDSKSAQDSKSGQDSTANIRSADIRKCVDRARDVLNIA